MKAVNHGLALLAGIITSSAPFHRCTRYAGTKAVFMKKGRRLMNNTLEKIKQIAEQMPDSPEKEQGLQAYENLKMFETIAVSFEQIINPESRKESL